MDKEKALANIMEKCGSVELSLATLIDDLHNHDAEDETVQGYRDQCQEIYLDLVNTIKKELE
jgi:hypothetical protein